MPQAAKSVECVIPVLHVGDVLASARFYHEVLGFAVEWGCETSDGLGSIGRDGCSIMLRGGGGSAIDAIELWIGVDDVDSIFEACQSHDVAIVHPPRDRHWAREMRIKDPDGHVLWFGSDPAPQTPRDA